MEKEGHEVQNELDEEIKTVDICNLRYEVSQNEFDYLLKVNEDDRLAALAILRFQFFVLSKMGKKKVNTMTLTTTKNAIRFMAEFVKHGMRGSNGRVEATDVRKIPSSIAIAKDEGNIDTGSVPPSGN